MVQRAKRLRDSRKFRRTESCVFVEGYEENKQAVYYGWRCFFQMSADEDFCERSQEQSYFSSNEVMQELCKKSTPSVIGVYESPEKKPDSVWSQKTLFVFDEIEKPGNLGAILRTAAATNHRSFVAVKNTVDLLNPQVIRNSLGHSLGVQCDYLERDEILSKAKEHGYELVLLDANLGVDLFEFKRSEDQKYLFVIGREHEGIHKSWYHHDHRSIKIPMDKSVDSLNVSVATAVLFYQLRN